MWESRAAKGAVLMVAASVGFCAMSGLVRYASDIAGLSTCFDCRWCMLPARARMMSQCR